MNDIQKYFYLLIVALLFACNQVQTITADKPKNLLNHEQMANILTELHVIEAIEGNENKIGDTATKVTMNSYKAVYAKYHVDEATFKKSFAYYKLQPIEIDSIYADVIEKLNAMEASYDASNFRGNLLNKDTTGNH